MSTQPIDLQLQLALAKMLPHQLRQIHNAEIYEFSFFWNNKDRGVYETEWLHIVWLVEQGLTTTQQMEYEDVLFDLATNGVVDNWFKATNASWQQRAIALCSVKKLRYETN